MSVGNQDYYCFVLGEFILPAFLFCSVRGGSLWAFTCFLKGGGAMVHCKYSQGQTRRIMHNGYSPLRAE